MTENRNKKMPKKRSARKTSKAKKAFKVISFTLMFLVLTAIVTLAGFAFAVIKSTSDINLADIQNLAQPAQFYSSSGEKVDTLLTSEHRFKLQSDEIPKTLKDAYVSIEDERFYDHQGVDVKRILGAALFNLKSKLSGNDALQGGSTLTQQLIKNTVLTDERNIQRKIKEAYLSLELEKIQSKDEIITAYLNTIPLGGTTYGVQAASQRYFSKNAKDLTLIESAYLAAVTQAPTTYDAFAERNQKEPERYIKRVKTVLMKMLELGKITQAEYDQGIKDLDEGKLKFYYKEPTNSLNYESFNRATINQVIQDLQDQLGYTQDEAESLIEKGGLHIYTTMDKNLQDEIQGILNERSNLGVPGSDTFDGNTPKLQASTVITDYKAGQVKVLIGGRGEQSPNGLNRAYNVLKPTGSSTKPLLAYAPAMDLKLVHPGSVFDDAPLEPALYSKYGNWNLNNYTRGVFSGYTTLRTGLQKSLNTIAVKTADKAGIKNIVAYGEKFGIKFNDTSKNAMSSLALGEFSGGMVDDENSDGSNPYYMANAFGAFGNGGIVTEAKLYTEIKDSNGKVVLKANPKKTQVISPQTAYVMNDMLQASGVSGAVPGIRTVGKTGTSSDNKNYWYSGLTGHYASSVWIGYDMPQSMGSSSSNTAGRLFKKVMTAAHKGKQDVKLEKPDGIISVSYCMDSGLIPTGLCSGDQRGSRVASTIAVSGSQPKSYCDVHVSAKVNKLNNKLANTNTPAALVANKVFLKKKHVHKGVNVADYKYMLPSGADDMTSIPPEDLEDPNEDGGATPPTDGGTTPPPPTDGGTTPPPSTGGGTTPPPTGGGTTPPPPTGGGTTPPPTIDGGTTPPPTTE
ncbi:MAG: transglycosylase domain-containing protein [Sarcina sp.]